jgi:hypothetical protein
MCLLARLFFVFFVFFVVQSSALKRGRPELFHIRRQRPPGRFVVPPQLDEGGAEQRDFPAA